MSSISRVVFGLVVPSAESELHARIGEFAAWISERIGVPVECRDAASYEALATDVREGRTDVAWLPPIVFVRLGGAVTPLASMVRGGSSTYEAALVVRASSKIQTLDGLRGTRAGWVDRWSAAGFVLPRMRLALLGIDPRDVFRTETFHGSHRAAVEALAAGACDVVGTYAHADADGNVTAGSWSEVDGADVRVLATFGAIPPDVFAVRTDAEARLGSVALGALKAACDDPRARSLVRALFGGDTLDDGLGAGYDALRTALEMGSVRGIFD